MFGPAYAAVRVDSTIDKLELSRALHAKGTPLNKLTPNELEVLVLLMLQSAIKFSKGFF